MTEPEAAGLAGCRVMVVEDELLVAMLIEEMLAERGCTVVGPFSTLSDAMGAANEAAADLAVLDVNLRGEKIYPVAEVLTRRCIPFVILSGYGQEALPAEHPDWTVCSKPFRANELIALLAAQLRRAPRQS